MSDKKFERNKDCIKIKIIQNRKKEARAKAVISFIPATSEPFQGHAR